MLHCPGWTHSSPSKQSSQVHHEGFIHGGQHQQHPRLYSRGRPIVNLSRLPDAHQALPCRSSRCGKQAWVQTHQNPESCVPTKGTLHSATSRLSSPI